MIIGITGRAGAGKNTLAEAIVGHGGGTIISFADPLRDVAAAAFGSRYETHAEKDAVDEWWQGRLGRTETVAGEGHQMLTDQPITGRRILQYFGTEVFRELVHPDFWLFAMERRLTKLTAHLVAIPDVRFDNEAAFIRKLGGIVVEVQRLNLPPSADSHVSERGVTRSLIDQVLLTDSTEETRKAGAQLGATFAPMTEDPVLESLDG